MKSKHIKEGIIGAGLILLAITHWLPLGIQFLELAGAFAHFTLMISAIIAVLSTYKRLLVLTGLALAAVCVSGTLVMGNIGSLTLNGKGDFTIAQFNVYHNNPTPERAILELSVQNADIFTIQELNSDWSVFTDSVFELSHPFTIEAPWDSCCYGTGLYAKFPILSYEVLGIENSPVIIAVIDVRGTPVTIVSLHTYAPAFPNETKRRNAQLKAVAKLTSTEKDQNVIVIGDLNIVPWDETFKEFLETGKLTAVRDGFQATYPMDFGFPLIPIDHITHSNNLVPKSCEAVIIPGSDHRGLIAGFKFKD